MKMLRITSCALLLFGLVVARPAQAQTPWELGPLVGVNLDNDELLVGAVARIPLTSLSITLNPGLEFYPGIENGSLFVLNFDLQYQLDAETVKPYVGAGLSWARFSPDGGSSSSDVGLNLKGGLLLTLLAVLAAVVLVPELAQAQCAMCVTALEQNGGEMAAGFNRGILFLLGMPYLVFTVIGASWLWKHYQRERHLRLVNKDSPA